MSRLKSTISRLLFHPSRLTLAVCLSWFLSWIGTLSSRLTSHVGVTWLVTWQTSSSLLPFSLLFTLHIYITGFVAHSKLPWISDVSVYWWLRRVFSLATLLLYYFIDYANALALAPCILFHVSCLLLCYTMRGRPFVVVVLWVTFMLPCHTITSDYLVTCFLLTHVYHLTI